MNKTFSKFTLILSIFSFVYSFAWGLTGHRVVAEIAQRHLNNKAKRNIQKLLGNENLVYYANWADQIKSDTTGVWKEASAWHYVNVNPQKNLTYFTDSLMAQKSPNIYTEIINLTKKIKDKNTSEVDKKTSLFFLIHLIGDLHQPLHVGRAEDYGGNKIKVTYFGQNTNLHTVWDSKLIDDQKYSYTEYANLLDIRTKEEVKAIQSGSLADWLYDSHNIANSIYYHTPNNAKLSYEYGYRFIAVAENQMIKSGLRLASVLNEIFG